MDPTPSTADSLSSLIFTGISLVDFAQQSIWNNGIHHEASSKYLRLRRYKSTIPKPIDRPLLLLGSAERPPILLGFSAGVMLRPDSDQTSPSLIVGCVHRHDDLRSGVVDQVHICRSTDHGGKPRPRPGDSSICRRAVLKRLLQIVGLEAGQLPFND